MAPQPQSRRAAPLTRKAVWLIFGAYLTLLFFGCSKSKEELVKELAGMNLQFNAEDFVRSAAEDDQKALALFFAAGFNVNAQNAAGKTALMVASERGKTGLTKQLLDRKADPNVTGPDGVTALILAAQNDQPDIVKILLQNRADPDKEDNNGWTALSTAAYHGSARCVQILADRSKTDLSRALLFATLSERKDVIKILLDYGAEVDSRSGDGRTPLILAASKGNKDLVSMLLQAGADPSLTDQSGATAESTAAAKGFREIAELLHGRTVSKPPSTPAVVSGSPSPSATPTASLPRSSPNAAISDADILRQPGPSTSGGASPNPKLDQNPSGGLANKISVLEVQEAFLPVTVQEVHSKKATLRSTDGADYSVEVGDQLKGLDYRVIDIQNREVDDKDGNAVDASVVKLRHIRTGQTISLIKGIPAREHGAFAVLSFTNGGATMKVELDRDFTLPDDPSHTYRVLDIRPTQVVVKRLNDNEVWTLQKTAR
ncbi:MAG TPA: ankyrin repeat domain-containing protein [Chthoniobacterales bacterium]|nr:ankyrin repeat domain-containing protein [Chthoniobacterales bacterium]